MLVFLVSSNGGLIKFFYYFSSGRIVFGGKRCNGVCSQFLVGLFFDVFLRVELEVGVKNYFGGYIDQKAGGKDMQKK